MSEQKKNTQAQPAKKRLLSVDALRGFDMFWIIGAEGLFSALFILTGLTAFEDLAQQMKHSQWHGLTAYDLIFPLFIFLSGVTIGITSKPISHYPENQQKTMYGLAVKRLLLMCLLGILYNHGWGTGLPTDWNEIRYASVLGKIAIAWYVATLLVWHCSIKQQWIISIVILIGYWLLITCVEIGQYGANYTLEWSINAWIDQFFLPGVRYQHLATDPEGLLANIPSVVNAMIGVFVGRHMRKRQVTQKLLCGELAVAGFVLLLMGYLWSEWLPINKVLWTSSFVLVSSGYSIWLLGLFYGLIDVLKWQKFGQFFAVIGMNSILIYVSSSLVDWHYITSSIFGQFITTLPSHWSLLFSTLSLLLVQWLILFWCYRRNIFLKV